ncbi:ABC transporter ATP-binding protein [Paenibacillus frigoriresistens]|uniref:ABC transporter ATP-binding protein n=1 Tax=Paenibacillus alginolyticus TaxID=59839 RepID=UPI001566A9F0|nr:ABC transporter ATP-binding protein [Paenibacillus frigoriresistens]NRF94378.1 ABC transporter ATP-binding protein [Paenibacillus frigoriresistens]
MEKKAILQVKGLSLEFVGLQVLSNIELDVEEGSIHSIIGPNGAGKSSLLNCINGFYHHYQGNVLFNGRSVPRGKPHLVASLGIARVFQEVELFRELTVLENILLGRHLSFSYHVLNALIYYGKTKKQEAEHRNFCEALAIKIGLGDELHRPVEELPYGIQKKVELARALALEPKVLLLDEPMAGMTRVEKNEVIQVLQDIRRDMAITMVVIEHDLNVVMRISDRVSVLNFGSKVAEGTPNEIQNEQNVIEAYIGIDHELVRLPF